LHPTRCTRRNVTWHALNRSSAQATATYAGNQRAMTPATLRKKAVLSAMNHLQRRGMREAAAAGRGDDR
jgi:hypothetical protein